MTRHGTVSVATAVNPASLMRPRGFSHGCVAAGRVLFIAGQVARAADGTVVGAGDLVAQFRRVCEGLRDVVGEAGGALTDIVKLTIYVLDVPLYKRHGAAIGAVYREFFGRHYPAMTLVGARDLYDAADGCLIEIEGVAILPEAGRAR